MDSHDSDIMSIEINTDDSLIMKIYSFYNVLLKEISKK